MLEHEFAPFNRTTAAGRDLSWVDVWRNINNIKRVTLIVFGAFVCLLFAYAIECGLRHTLSDEGRAPYCPVDVFQVNDTFWRDLHADNRERLAASLPTGSWAFFASNNEQLLSDSDTDVPFTQDPAFQWVSGVLEPDFNILLSASNEAIIFMPRQPWYFAIWTGFVLTPAQVKETYGVSRVLYNDEFSQFVIDEMDSETVIFAYPQAELPIILPTNEPLTSRRKRRSERRRRRRRSTNTTMTTTTSSSLSSSSSSSSSSSASLSTSQSSYGYVYETLTTDMVTLNRTVWLQNIVYTLRDVKSEYEVALMTYAATVSAEAHTYLMENVRVGTTYEFNIAGWFVQQTWQCDLLSQAYAPIVGSGETTGLLHYTDGTGLITSDELVLVDAGGAFRNYGTDITRTFPASGEFTEQQRSLYDMLLSVQEMSIEMVKVGADWYEDVVFPTLRLLLSSLIDAGFFSIDKNALTTLTDEEVEHLTRVIMPHGLGHFVGLTVHDTSIFPTTVLKENMVVTIEPGIYANNASLTNALADDYLASVLTDLLPSLVAQQFGGIRIEDTVLVASPSPVILSAGVPKKSSDIELIMKRAGRR